MASTSKQPKIVQIATTNSPYAIYGLDAEGNVYIKQHLSNLGYVWVLQIENTKPRR